MYGKGEQAQNQRVPWEHLPVSATELAPLFDRTNGTSIILRNHIIAQRYESGGTFEFVHDCSQHARPALSQHMHCPCIRQQVIQVLLGRFHVGHCVPWLNLEGLWDPLEAGGLAGNNFREGRFRERLAPQ